MSLDHEPVFENILKRLDSAFPYADIGGHYRQAHSGWRFSRVLAMRPVAVPIM